MIKLEKIQRIQKKNYKTKIMKIKIKKYKIMGNANNHNHCFQKKLMQLIIKNNLVRYFQVFSFLMQFFYLFMYCIKGKNIFYR